MNTLPLFFRTIVISFFFISTFYSTACDVSNIRETDKTITHVVPYSAFLEAIVQGNEKEVRRHLGDDAYVDAQDIRGRSALSLALETKHVEIAQLLMRYGARITNDVIFAVVSDEKEEDRQALIWILVNKKLSEKDLNLACPVAILNGNLPALEILYNHGARISLSDPICARAMETIVGRVTLNENYGKILTFLQNHPD